ncbi:UNVERIFIED_CONTAM: hypothetical protein NCL1_60899 [Trichonephila clavipes]
MGFHKLCHILCPSYCLLHTEFPATIAAALYYTSCILYSQKFKFLKHYKAGSNLHFLKPFIIQVKTNLNLVTQTAVPLGLSSNPTGGMNVCKSIVPLQHGTINGHKSRRKPADYLQGVLPQNWGGIEPDCTGQTDVAHFRDELLGPRPNVTVNQVA